MPETTNPHGPFIWDTKDPQERFDYEHDWGSRLVVNGADVGDTIRTSADPDVTKRPSLVVLDGDVVIDAIVLEGTKIQYWLSGGTDGVSCKLEGTIWTEQDRCYQATFKLKIKQV